MPSENTIHDMIDILSSLLDEGALLDESSHLIQDLNLDSLTLVSFIFLCEDRFSVSLSAATDDPAFVPTIRCCAEYIDARREPLQ